MPGSFRSGAAWMLSVWFIAAACTSPPPALPVTDADPNGEITTPMRGTPVRIDPQRGDFEAVRHMAMVFEGLMTLDQTTLTPIPAAAKDQPRVSDDGLTYTFVLRDGLTYSDGMPLTAKDFVYAFSRLCDPAVRSPPFPIVRVVVGCQALRGLDAGSTPPNDLLAAKSGLGFKANGDGEFVVALKEPASWLTAIVATPLSYPVRESDVVKAGAAYGSEAATLVGNGPFKLVEWQANERLVFERNERYRTPARLKRWTKVVVPDELAFAAYRNKEIDLFGGLPSGRVAAVGAYLDVIETDAELRTQVVKAPGAFTDLYLLNASRAPFTDRKVRQAFAKAFDREAFIREVVKIGDAAFSFIPPGRPGHDRDDDFQSFDAAQARELLRSSSFAGRSELSGVRITIRSSDPQGRLVGELLQQQVKRNLGLEIGIEAVDPTVLGQMSANPRTAPQIIQYRWNGLPPDPRLWLDTFGSAGAFSAALSALVGYGNAEFDTLLRDADRARDPQRRLDLLRRAQRILSEDAVAIWLWWGPNEYLRRPWVKGVTDSGIDAEYGILRLHEIYVTKRP